MHLAENSVVAGRFRLIGLLGRGGMGSVWRATHLGLDIPCAVKFIEGELAALPEAQARFEREAKAAAQLRSPHVVQILDHGVCEGTPYIAMELLEGEDLGKRIARVGRLPARELHNIVSQVCRALTKAHSVGIVHRDFKPDNIFLVRDDDREIAKVLDFGIAKSQMHDLSGSSNTKTGAMLGTPYYMSPEQAQGTKQVDYRTDLWALAVICFQGLTGRLPFESEALGDLLVRIIVSPIPVPSQVGVVPPGFDVWWQKAASRDPRERFASAKDFSDSLAMVCGVTQPGATFDAPHAQVPAGPPHHPPPQFQSHPQFGGSGAPVAGTAAPMSRTLDGPPSRTKVPSKAGPIALVVGLLVLTMCAGGVAVWKLRGSGGTDAAHAAAGGPAASVELPSPDTRPFASPSASASAKLAPVAALQASATTTLPPAVPPEAVAMPPEVSAEVVIPPTTSPPSMKAPAASPGRNPAPPAAARPPGAKPGKPAYDVGF